MSEEERMDQPLSQIGVDDKGFLQRSKQKKVLSGRFVMQQTLLNSVLVSFGCSGLVSAGLCVLVGPPLPGLSIITQISQGGEVDPSPLNDKIHKTLQYSSIGGGTAGVLEDVNGIREAGGESEEGKSLDEARGKVVAIAVLR
ncbi:hypothetical protein LguiB_029442 [Lonicera macranthoides]